LYQITPSKEINCSFELVITDSEYYASTPPKCLLCSSLCHPVLLRSLPLTESCERFILSCTSKGIATDKTGTVSLCSSCWIWRRLPSNYSPQYINELLCDKADVTCLSGYASCVAGHHAIEVVRNDNGIMTTVVLSAGSYCECRAAVSLWITSIDCTSKHDTTTTDFSLRLTNLAFHLI
uniref:RING-type E3 ubiquitin transferase n=1 Tax=Angiostrongylus cantonensis TaxID=6313 RepID=A0A0K0D9U1_ANGCA